MASISWFFNKTTIVNGEPTTELVNQYYFEIDPNLEGELDMTGWVLPPIGTPDRPFVGTFNGNGKIISNLVVSNDFNDFNTHPSDVTSINYVPPDIVGFFGVVGNKTGLTNYSSSANEISTLGLKDLTVETASATTLVGLAAGYVDAEIENVAIENPTLIVSDGSATNYNDSLTENISDYLAVGYCKDTNQKRYTADISKVTNSIYNVNVSTLQPFTITEQGINAGWGGSIDMLEMYTNLDNDWNTLNHQYADSPTINSIAYDSSRTDNFDINGILTSSSVTGQTNNTMPYDDYGAINNSNNSTDPHKYFNVPKSSSLKNEDTNISENLQTSSISYVVQSDGTSKAQEERFMCLTGRKDVTISEGMTVTTNGYPTYTGKYISSTSGGNTYYLTVTNNAIVNNSTSQTTPWVVADNKLFTSNGSNGKRYLVCSNNGTLSLTDNENSASDWTYTASSNSFSTTIGNNVWALCYNSGAWKCQTMTVNHYLIHDQAGHYLKHNGNNNVNLENSSYAVSNPTVSDTNFWWYKNGNNYRTTSNGDRYLVNYETRSGSWWSGYTYTYSLRADNTSSNYMTFDGEYFTNNGRSIYYNSSNSYFMVSDTSQTIMVLEPVFSNAPSLTYNGSSSFKAYNTAITNENSTLSIPHTYFPLRYDGNDPDVKNTGYVVSDGEFKGNPYGDIRVSSYGISTYLSGVNTTDSTGTDNKKYKKINDVYTKTFNTTTGALTDTTGNSNADTVYANSERYSKSKEALQYVFGGQSNAYGLHFMDAQISDADPAVVPGAVVNGSIYKNLELPTDCIDFNLKEKGVINFFAGSYYKDQNTNVPNKSFFSLYEVDREEPVSSADVVNTEDTITLTYKGLDTNKKMKFAYSSDPFNVEGHTFNHVSINGNLVNEEGEPFDITNYTGNQQQFFTFSKGSKKYEYFNLKFYDDQGDCYLDFDATTQRTKLNGVRRISKVYSASGDTEGKQSYCYEYDADNILNNGNETYYMYVMGRKVDLDGETPYVEGRVTNSLPTGYDTMKFSTTCIEVGPYGGTLSMNNNKGYVYYFEIPMNEGEFALGSVKDNDGAYLMYLDIAANASLIKRTEITEHFVFSNQLHKYPLGVAIVLDAEDALNGLTANPVVPIDPTESIFVELDDNFNGVINIELSVISTVKTATLVRANMPNAPNPQQDYSVAGHATIQYISDDLAPAHGTKSLDVNHDPEHLVSCTDETSINSLKEYYSSEVVTDIKRLNYYDFSVTDGATWTQITQVNNNSNTRTVYQEINDVAAAQDKIKIYSSSNGRSTTEDQIDFTGLTFNSADNTIVIKYYYVTGDAANVTNVITLDADINSDNYYETEGYSITVTNSGGQIKIIIRSISTSEEIASITLNGGAPSTSTPIYVPVV